jgi:hypothetical protein
MRVDHALRRGVTPCHETLLEEGGAAVGDDAIALHLSEAQASVARATLHGLPRENLHGTAAAAVDLIVHHVVAVQVDPFERKF